MSDPDHDTTPLGGDTSEADAAPASSAPGSAPDSAPDSAQDSAHDSAPGSDLDPAAAPAAPVVASDGTIRSGKLAGRSMKAAIWMLAWPVLIQQTLQAFVGMADKLFAGRLPEAGRVAALDAIGIGSYIGWFIGIAMAGLGIGGQALIARAMGAGDRDQSHRALGQAMTLSLLWGVLVAVVLATAAAPMGRVTGLSEAAQQDLVTYLRILAISMPMAGVMMVGAMCLHGAGETTRPSWIAIGVNVVNVVTSWLLSGVDVPIRIGEWQWTLMNPMSLDMGVAGIAGGTAIGYTFGALCTAIVLRRGVKDLKLETRDLGFDRVMFTRIVRIGLPNFAEGISMWAVNLFVLVFIGIVATREAAGEGLQGAHIIAVQWEAFSFLPGYAIGIAAGTLAGQYLGAGSPELARRAIVLCVIAGAIFMSLLGVVFMTLGEPLTRIISSEPIHLETVPRLLFICGTMQVFFAITMVIRQGLRGVGDTKWCLIMTTTSSYLVRLPATWLLGVHFGLGLEGIWIGLCGEFFVRAMLFGGRFLHGGWSRVRV
ncbi:MAG: MATE family efflux transporter [Phycisphaerales bacterium]